MKKSDVTRPHSPPETASAAITTESRSIELGPLPRLLGYALRRAQVAVFSDFMMAFTELDLRPAQFSTLVLIDANPGCKQSDAAVALGIMQPNFVALMDELESRGLAQRTPAKGDRRSHALILTPKGKQQLKKASAAVVEHEARVTSALSPAEIEQLFAMLGRIELSIAATAVLDADLTVTTRRRAAASAGGR